MTEILGLDIGGANIKAAYIKIENKALKSKKVLTKYFPIWKKGREKLEEPLKTLRSNFTSINLLALTMTAELSDVYFSKKEGVLHILNIVENVFSNIDVKVLSVKGKLLTIEEGRKNALEVAAANWFATGWLASKLSKDCVVVDVGSTTTSIIPVLKGEVAAKGLNDLEKLMIGELVYTGVLRTNVAAIVSQVPIKGKLIDVSSEFFAQSGDIHLILGNIKPSDYTVDTPDGRGTSLSEAAARIARVVCADLDLLTLNEAKAIAKYVYKAQIQQIVKGLRKLIKNFPALKFKPAYTAGLGGKILAWKALKKAGFKDLRDLSTFIGVNEAKAAPAFSLALMGAEFLEGKIEGWKLC
ncbi:H4MPT-linked C1 transfer pathway protein [Candidatus Bathyarchaeota archaeon]|nr:H4MPT-linked C1 transfer pathway protein [Candidatus Bathyarchaeota archaeon]